jgi:steroid delta-isomerase-like uncharacterized protein
MAINPDAREVGRRWFEEVWNARRDEDIEELMAAESYGHVEGGEVRGPAGFRQMRAVFLSALPDVRIEIEDILAEGDRAAVRWRAVGTHTGDGFGFPATNRKVDIRGTSWLVVRDGKLIEGWDTWNLNGLLESLKIPTGGLEKKLF